MLKEQIFVFITVWAPRAHSTVSCQTCPHLAAQAGMLPQSVTGNALKKQEITKVTFTLLHIHLQDIIVRIPIPLNKLRCEEERQKTMTNI